MAVEFDVRIMGFFDSEKADGLDCEWSSFQLDRMTDGDYATRHLLSYLPVNL